jgi:hypothetical protein
MQFESMVACLGGQLRVGHFLWGGFFLHQLALLFEIVMLGNCTAADIKRAITMKPSHAGMCTLLVL